MTARIPRARWVPAVGIALLTLVWPQRASGQGQILEQQNSCFRCHRVIDDPRFDFLMATNFYGGSNEAFHFDVVQNTLKKLGADVRYTELPNANHNAWDPAYNDEELIKWMLAQRRP